MLTDYLDYPDKTEWNEIVKEYPLINQLHLEIDPKNISHRDLDAFVRSIEYDSWQTLLNNRLGGVHMTFVFLMHYFNKGIPDDDWNKSPGSNGSSVHFYHKFDNKHFYIKTMFDYYASIYYYKIFSVIDSIFHLINVYYQMNITPKPGFIKHVMDSLKDKNSVLYAILLKHKRTDVLKEAKKIRNSFTHNYPVTDISSGISKEHTEEKSIVSFGLGNYTKSKDIQENSYQVIELFNDVFKEIKTTIEK